MPDLLDKRLLFVTGKGGAGKTTVAAALGLAAARRGKRTIVCEVAQQERLWRAFSRSGEGAGTEGTTRVSPRGYREVELAPGLHAISLDPARALEEYLRLKLGSRALYRLLFENRIFQYLAAATPGLAEMTTISKVWELAQLDRRTPEARPYDLVVLDAPATGHGLGMLQAPRTFREAARAGPIHARAERVETFVSDPSLTGVVVVALPEEMPVSEALALHRSLFEELSREADVTVVNALLPERFRPAEAEDMRSAAESESSRAGREALAAALSGHRQARAQRVHLRRLKREAGRLAASGDEAASPDGRGGRGAPAFLTLPFVFDSELGAKSFELLSRELERQL